VLSVLIDPAHGGIEPGALFEGTTAEKDINLAFARRLRQELALRGLWSELVRDADQTLSSEERAARANARRPALYLVIHSSSEGSGLAIYSAILSESASARGPFLNWESVQSQALERSRTFEQKLAAAIDKTGFPIRSLSARLRPLNNVAVPALAVELSPTRGGAAQLSSADYQRMVAAALANALNSIAPYLRVRADSAP
jgi:N-acetylmuramoyl-L-alanine amidase